MEIADFTFDEVTKFITGSFSPALTLEVSEVEMTTKEIYIKIVEHLGEIDLTLAQLATLLKHNGFKSFSLPGSMDFVWGFAEKI